MQCLASTLVLKDKHAMIMAIKITQFASDLFLQALWSLDQDFVSWLSMWGLFFPTTRWMTWCRKHFCCESFDAELCMPVEKSLGTVAKFGG